MKTSEIKQLTTSEIIERIDDGQLMLVRQRLNHAISPLDNPHQIVQSRRDIARLKTELRIRKINENKDK
ncbi:MAG: 50S ribosomal protein L29 [Bacteroidetes bacterium]|nr:MAG: 50S ribosomal protein L29 [Bacteroidota bacterium]